MLSKGDLDYYFKYTLFDTYSYAYVSEDIVEDIVSEAIVRFNPSNLYTSAITKIILCIGL